MISRHGPTEWQNVHFTTKTQLADLILVDNTTAGGGARPTGFAALRQTALELDTVIREAQQQGQRIRALGAGWALTDIAATDGWLINTKALNSCFEVSDRYFDTAYEAQKRPFVLIAQAGMSMGELNVYLEVTGHAGLRRALQTSGIGAGQTVAGAISGNTHGAGIRFGSTPDFVVGMQLVTGSGTSYWIERATKPILNDLFVSNLGATVIRDDDVFNAALVSFGSFGIISAVAIETAPIYHLQFSPVGEVDDDSLKRRLRELATTDFADPMAPYHYEFVFDPYDNERIAIEASARKIEYDPTQETPAQVWIVRGKAGLALGDKVAKIFLEMPLIPSKTKTELQFKLYRERAILDNVRGTPGQMFTATISYFEGYTESALAVSIEDAPAMLDISRDVIRRLDQPCVSQVRLVHPTRALLGFTCHAPKTAVFEFGLVNNSQFPQFEKTLTDELRQANVQYTLHWSKNAGIEHAALLYMYGMDRVNRWRAARDRVFGHAAALKKVFDNAHLQRAGLT